MITKSNSYLTELQEARFKVRKERKAKEQALQEEKETRRTGTTMGKVSKPRDNQSWFTDRFQKKKCD